VDTNFNSPLDGRHNIKEFFLIPCLNTVRNSELGCSSFILGFDFQGIHEEGFDSRENTRRSFVNKGISDLKAKSFLSWIVCATRQYARLSNISFGGRMTGGPSFHIPTTNFNEDNLRIFNPDPNAKDGEFVTLQRPILQGPARLSRPLKLPSDFPSLTGKLFSLSVKEKQRFMGACFSYQFALENWSPYPTVSVVSLVSAVESMMSHIRLDDFCREAGISCRLKENIMKKFQMFFEQNLTSPLSPNLKQFLKRVYSRRSYFVHKALLGQTMGICGVYGQHFADDFEQYGRLMEELSYLEILVNAGLMQWLTRF
jgi:hypothetical protein